MRKNETNIKTISMIGPNLALKNSLNIVSICIQFIFLCLKTDNDHAEKKINFLNKCIVVWITITWKRDRVREECGI